MKTQHASDASKRDGNATEQYFATEPSSEDVRRRMKVTLRGQDAVVEVSNGVFSGSRLDLGCGWGPVSLALAFASPKADVWAVDVNERALDLTRANAKSNGCEHIHAASPEQVPADLTFDAIWSNPPIRIGKDALHDLLMTWLPRLNPAGAAYLVVQKNLGADSLIPWLATALGDDYEVSKYHSAKGYRVIEVLRNK